MSTKLFPEPVKITFGDFTSPFIVPMEEIKNLGGKVESITLEIEFDPAPLIEIDGELMRLIVLPEPRGKK